MRWQAKWWAQQLAADLHNAPAGRYLVSLNIGKANHSADINIINEDTGLKYRPPLSAGPLLAEDFPHWCISFSKRVSGISSEGLARVDKRGGVIGWQVVDWIFVEVEQGPPVGVRNGTN